MNITLATKEFSDALQIGGSYAFGGIKRVLPITECVKIEIKEGVLRIFSTDGENSISKRYGDVECDDYSFCVQYKDIIEYVKMIDSSHLSIEVSVDDKQVTISHDNGSMKLPLFNEEEFPTIPFAEKDDVNYKVDANQLKLWMKIGEPFLKNDPLKTVNESLYFDFSREETSFCAGDGSGIIYGFLNSDSGIEKMSVIINKTNFRNIINAIGGADVVRMWDKENHIMFAANGVLISVRKMDVKYYNFRNVVKPCEENNFIKVVVERDELINAIKRIMVTRDAYNSVRFSLNGDSITLTSNNLDTAKDASETLKCESTDNIDVQISGEKVLKALYCFQSDKVIFRFKDYSHPFLVGSDTDYYSALLMPMMLNTK
jgi:DNA polymerase III sliding clamp (beta) subunit (PCNA family)